MGIIGEAIEDEMLLEAIKDGEGAEEVSREEIFKGGSENFFSGATEGSVDIPVLLKSRRGMSTLR